MPIDVPNNPKVYTTVYDNFKGVDYTNDATNVWRKRSPTGYNMLPDDAGRPFKRTGWEVVIDSDTIMSLIGSDYAILKCYYFELGGIDHIVIFCDVAVLLYVEDELLLLTTDEGCCANYERCFFFEGDGKSAFYIYGNQKAWMYDGAFSRCIYSPDGLTNPQGRIYVPTILFQTDPSTCAGTTLESHNLIGNRVAIEYTSNSMFHYYDTCENATALVDKATFTDKVSSALGTYAFVYLNSKWLLDGSEITLGEYGITIDGTPLDNDKIVVKYVYGVLLSSNISPEMVSDVMAFGSAKTQFDTVLNVSVDPSELANDTCVLYTDVESLPESNRKAWVEFNKLYAEGSLVQGEDTVRVVFPVVNVVITNYVEQPGGAMHGLGNIGTASLVV